MDGLKKNNRVLVCTTDGKYWSYPLQREECLALDIKQGILYSKEAFDKWIHLSEGKHPITRDKINPKEWHYIDNIGKHIQSLHQENTEKQSIIEDQQRNIEDQQSIIEDQQRSIEDQQRSIEEKQSIIEEWTLQTQILQ